MSYILGRKMRNKLQEKAIKPETDLEKLLKTKIDILTPNH